MIRGGADEQLDFNDFLETHYRELLCQARKSYTFATYECIPWGERFVLWRHDVDYSLNRALRLARIEAEMGVRATYFINPRSDFYNLFETTQVSAVRSILDLGHEVGLHFDSACHQGSGDSSLESGLHCDARLISSVFGISLAAFSFHNPDAADLRCDEELYGGLINCYSRRFRTEVGYCSDSNGFWRFRRLMDVLEVASDRCLQVLTHPGWWQSKLMAPRSRILRCVYGRAAATMRAYDQVLIDGQRANLRGPPEVMEFLREIDREAHERIGTLWGLEHLEDTLFALRRLLGRWKGRNPSRPADPEMDAIDSLCARLLDGVASPSPKDLEDACTVICARLKTCVDRHASGAG